MSSPKHSRTSARRSIGFDGRPIGASPSPKFFGGLTRRSKRIAIAIATPAIFIAAIAGGITAASACEPVIQAGANCDGTVSFTAKAWNDGSATDELRTNTNVEIQYSINGTDGPFETVKSTGANYKFDKANGFAFSGKFNLPENVKRPTTVTVQAVAVAKWGSNADLDTANQSAKTTIKVEDCASVVPAVKISSPTCTTKYAVVEMTNPGNKPVEFRLYRDGSSTPFDTQTVGKGTTSHNVTIDEDTNLKVEAPNMTTVTQSVPVPQNCTNEVPPVTTPTVSGHPEQPAQSVPPAQSVQPVQVKVVSAIAKQCTVGGSGFVVALDNTANTTDRQFSVNAGAREVEQVTVPAGQTKTAAYSFATVGIAVGATDTITVKTGDTVVVSAPIVNDCIASSAGIALACDTAAGSGAVLSFQNTGQLPDTFTVTRDGKPVTGTPFTLQPSTMTTQKLLRLADGESANISITSTSGLQLSKSVELECETVNGVAKPVSVKAQPVSRNALAATGYDFEPLLIVGGALLVMGLGALAARRIV